MVYEWRCGEYVISTDRERLDLGAVHGFLSRASYWAGGITMEVVARSVEHSLPFGVYNTHQQVGFARVITDYATFAYVADVFILAPFRGQGLGKWLMRTIVSHPDLQGLRRFLLATKDAHGLYAQCGFRAPEHPDAFMEIAPRNFYTRGRSDPGRMDPDRM